jgi:nitrite reductase (NAD(P)H)
VTLTAGQVMEECGEKKDAVGCETCKPAIGNILASLFNENVMDPVHHQNQDTNDRFMANIQVRSPNVSSARSWW